MLTINADHHPIMKHFHKPEDEKRSIIVLQNHEYHAWLNANHEQASKILNLAPDSFLISNASPR